MKNPKITTLLTLIFAINFSYVALAQNPQDKEICTRIYKYEKNLPKYLREKIKVLLKAL